MKWSRYTVLQWISILLVALFAYTAVSKLLVINTFRHQMLNQALPRMVDEQLVWALPLAELATVTCLIVKPLRRIGLWLSTILMTLFTGYVALVVFHAFDRVPCACGGVLQSLGWTEHLVFNVVFLVVAILGVAMNNKKVYKL